MILCEKFFSATSHPKIFPKIGIVDIEKFFYNMNDMKNKGQKCQIHNCNRGASAKLYCRFHYCQIYEKRPVTDKPTKIRRPGLQRGDSKHPLYRVWSGMMSRCYNSKATGFEYWGGRGIKVCDKWHVFTNFVIDMGERPRGYSLDRIDFDGNYEPINCRWISSSEQNSNRRPYKAEREWMASRL